MNELRKFGWIPDKNDRRDIFYSTKLIEISNEVDLTLSDYMPPIYNQGSLGSCVFNAIGAAFQFLLPIENKVVFMPSRLFPYYNYRKKYSIISQDTGASIRNAIKVYVKQGVCDELLWPYDEDYFMIKPKDICYITSMDHQILKYHRIQNIIEMEQCIAEGYPFVGGIHIYESFQNLNVVKTGYVPMPDTKAEKFYGGHAVLFVGYDRNKKLFKVRNSWGDNWGDKGYFYLPYEFINYTQGLANDFWTIRLTE